MSVSTTLLKRAEEYEAKAKALRIAAAELNGHATLTAQATIEGKLKAAQRLRTPQAKTTAYASMNRPQLTEARLLALKAFMTPGTEYRAVDLAEHLTSLGFPDVHTSTISNALHVLGAHQHGSRTQSRWTLGGSSTRPHKQHSSKIRAQRQKSAELLAKIAKSDTPVPAGKIGPVSGALVRRGYLKKVGDGYVRTEKEYVV